MRSWSLAALDSSWSAWAANSSTIVLPASSARGSSVVLDTGESAIILNGLPRGVVSPCRRLIILRISSIRAWASLV